MDVTETIELTMTRDAQAVALLALMTCRGLPGFGVSEDRIVDAIKWLSEVMIDQIPVDALSGSETNAR